MKTISKEHKEKISKANKGRKRPDLIERNKKNTKEKIKVVCKCGKKFFVSPSRIKNGVKYCSQKCYHKYVDHNHTEGKHWKLSKETKKKQGLHQLGKNNHQWNGGYFRGKYIGIPESKEFSRKVFKRDNYLCQICGNTGRKSKLNAHHLNSVDKFPEQVIDINNGITLCQECHIKFHKKFGYGKNTKKQFEEFITEEITDIKTILMNKSIIYNLTLEGEDTFFANGILTHNTPPHIIKPKDKQALHWGGKNGPIVKQVRHPGQRPNPFIRNTIQNKIGKIVQEEILKSF